jgi:aromatic-L-amino-acid decarboxylase
MTRPTRLDELESAARRLELDAQTRAQQLAAIAEYGEQQLEAMLDKPVYMRTDEVPPRDELLFSEEATEIDTALEILSRQVDQEGVNIGSPGFLGFIPGGGLYSSALGDYLAAVTNRYPGVRYSSPGAARLEAELVRWLAEAVGYPATAGGDHTSGGSIANLSGVVAAREAAGLKSTDIAKSVVYLTKLTHHSVVKALRIAGLADCVTRVVALDDVYRMDAQALNDAINADRDAGLNPWMVVATAGTTDLGTVDPLTEIAEIAKRNDVWVHVDGAYGGAFVLCDEGKRRLAGIEQSNSLVIDPHKGLFLPFGSGMVLVRDIEDLHRAYSSHAPYMDDTRNLITSDEYSAHELSPELSRPFRGLRFWLPLKVHGLAPFRAALEEKLLLAEYFYKRITTMDRFEVGPQPDLSIVTFRYVPERGDANEFNLRLVDEIRRDGRVFLSSTVLDGRVTQRMAILNYNTHLDKVDETLAVLAEKVLEIEQG